MWQPSTPAKWRTMVLRLRSRLLLISMRQYEQANGSGTASSTPTLPIGFNTWLVIRREYIFEQFFFHLYEVMLIVKYTQIYRLAL